MHEPDRDQDGKKLTFDYMLANPPFGVEWKQQATFIEKEHKTLGHHGRFGAGLPRINDGALLFLQHMLSKRRARAGPVVGEPIFDELLSFVAANSAAAGDERAEVRDELGGTEERASAHAEQHEQKACRVRSQGEMPRPARLNPFDLKLIGGYQKKVLVDDPSLKLREFLRDYVSSYEELEVLLLLAREARDWSAAELADELRAPVDMSAAAAEILVVVGGMVDTRSPAGQRRFVFAATTDELRAQVAELDRAYAERRLAVVQMMSANAVDRMRGAAIRRFADSFRLERPKK